MPKRLTIKTIQMSFIQRVLAGLIIVAAKTLKGSHQYSPSVL